MQSSAISSQSQSNQSQSGSGTTMNCNISSRPQQPDDLQSRERGNSDSSSSSSSTQKPHKILTEQGGSNVNPETLSECSTKRPHKSPLLGELKTASEGTESDCSSTAQPHITALTQAENTTTHSDSTVQCNNLASPFEDIPIDQSYPKCSFERSHVTTPSFGSSISFFTVRSHFSPAHQQFQHSAGLKEQQEVEVDKREEECREGDSVEECMTPTPNEGFRFAADMMKESSKAEEYECMLRKDVGCLTQDNGVECQGHPFQHFGSCEVQEDTEGLEEEEEEPEEEMQEEDQEYQGYAIKPLPNGMRCLPSPSVASRSFDLSSSASPFSRPLTLGSEHSLGPVLPTSAAAVAAGDGGGGGLVCSQEEQSEASTSSGDFSLPSTSTSGLISTPETTPTAPPHNISTLHPIPHSTTTNLARSETNEWGANFWCVVQDPSETGNNFFANPTTGECRWFLPKGTIVLPPSGEGEWWELIDEQTGREYYYHTKTKESRWTRPDLVGGKGLVIPMRAVQLSRHSKRDVAGAGAEAGNGAGVGGRREKRAEYSDGDGVKGSERDLHRVDKEVEADPSTIITTPLRPRTKSLPKQVKRERHPSSPPTTTLPRYVAPRSPIRAKKTQFQPTAIVPPPPPPPADITQKARTSILQHDQRVLSLARKTSTPPFKPEPLPLPPLYRPKQQRNRPSTTGTGIPKRPAHQVGLASSHTYPFLNHDPEAYHQRRRKNRGLGMGLHDGAFLPAAEVEIVPIRRVGKGLAFDSRSISPLSSHHASATTMQSVKTRRSLPFLSPTRKEKKDKEKEKEKDRMIVGLPLDLAQALSRLNCHPTHSAHDNDGKFASSAEGSNSRRTTSANGSEESTKSTSGMAKTKTGKKKMLTQLIGFARCRSVSFGASSRASSFGNL